MKNKSTIFALSALTLCASAFCAPALAGDVSEKFKKVTPKLTECAPASLVPAQSDPEASLTHLKQARQELAFITKICQTCDSQSIDFWEKSVRNHFKEAGVKITQGDICDVTIKNAVRAAYIRSADIMLKKLKDPNYRGLSAGYIVDEIYVLLGKAGKKTTRGSYYGKRILKALGYDPPQHASL